MVKYELDEDIVGLAKIISIGIVVLLVLAILFDFLATILADGYAFEFEIFGLVSTITFFLASLSALYGTFLILGKDDSNFMRIISIVFFLFLILVILGRL